MSKAKTIHPQLKTKKLPDGLRHVSMTCQYKPAVKADPKNGIKAAAAIKITENVIQLVETGEGLKVFGELLEKHSGGVATTRVAQHVNENLRKKGSQAIKACDTEAEARELLRNGLFVASTGPSEAKQQVKTFEAFQSAYVAEHGDKDPVAFAKAVAEFYMNLATAKSA